MRTLIGSVDGDAVRAAEYSTAPEVVSLDHGARCAHVIRSHGITLRCPGRTTKGVVADWRTSTPLLVDHAGPDPIAIPLCWLHRAIVRADRVVDAMIARVSDV